MLIKVKYNSDTKVFDVSKLTEIKDLKSMIQEKFSVDEALQRLIFKGKLLNNQNTLFDYAVNLNDVIQLWKREPLADQSNQTVVQNEKTGKDEVESQESKLIEEDAESQFFRVDDLVDILDSDEGAETAGGWFEGQIKRITREEGDSVVAGSDGLTYYVKYEAYEGDDYQVKLEQLRPRARKVLSRSDLELGMDVLVNYNMNEPSKRGIWVAGKVDKVSRQAVVCTLYVGVDLTPVPDCRLAFPEETMRLEAPVKLTDRDVRLDREMNTAVARKNPPKCETCLDNERKKCKECGCAKCGGKNDPDTILVCDECQSGYHLKCIGLETLPEEEEWYCHLCKNDDDIIKEGEVLKASKKKAKMPSQANTQKRDWGKGMATVGRTKECSMPKNHFGPIPGIEVGTQWLFRMQVSEAGIHRPPVGGIAGTEKEGCQSLVISGGYEDDVDDGEEFTYTGSGGRDLSGNKRTAEQSFDQTLTKVNAAIAKNCHAKFDPKNGGDAGDDWRKGKEIRVVRGKSKKKKHVNKFAPEEGNRYDGIYKVVKYWPQRGKAGFIVWRYLIRRDDPAPAPWTKEGQRRIEDGGWGELRKPENYEEIQLEKLKLKAAEVDKKEKESTSKKVAGKKRKDRSDDEEEPEARREKKAPVAKYKIPSDILKAMDSDKLNKRLWTDVKSKVFTTRKDLVDHVEREVECPFCCCILTSPVTMPCSHSYCQACINRAFKSKHFTCTTCRADLQDEEIVVNKEMRAVLLLIFPGYEN